ncbi:MAG: hypothetical protein KDB07_00585 [Planctomycetes bacterium]|nr:hypothetical protein [Planctomycetota bacterium]
MARTPEVWEVDNDAFWDSEGKGIALRNLWISIPDLLCGFALWIYWGMIAKFVQRLHFADKSLFNFLGADGQALSADACRGLLFTLPAVAGLAGATLRIPHSFMIALCGGRNVKFLTTLMLILPAIGSGIALQNPETPFFTLVLLAALSGVGGGAFASSMSNISFFFPKKMQGLVLGLNAGLGNLGVSVMQFLLPWVITFGLFGSLGGDPYVIVEAGKESSVWVQNAGLVWVPILGFLVIATWFFMNNLPQHTCGAVPKAFGRYFWLTLLGFGGAAAGVTLLMMDWGGVPELLKVFVVLVVTIGVTLALMRFLTPGDTK